MQGAKGQGKTRCIAVKMGHPSVAGWYGWVTLSGISSTLRIPFMSVPNPSLARSGAFYGLVLVATLGLDPPGGGKNGHHSQLRGRLHRSHRHANLPGGHPHPPWPPGRPSSHRGSSTGNSLIFLDPVSGTAPQHQYQRSLSNRLQPQL